MPAEFFAGKPQRIRRAWRRARRSAVAAPRPGRFRPARPGSL